MRRVIVESPYHGDTEKNITYARQVVKDCLNRGEAPIASHLLYTQPGVLNDNITEERHLGIEAGHAWLTATDALVVYTDLGISEGMEKGISQAVQLGIPVEYRTLSGI